MVLVHLFSGLLPFVFEYKISDISSFEGYFLDKMGKK